MPSLPRFVKSVSFLQQKSCTSGVHADKVSHFYNKKAVRRVYTPIKAISPAVGHADKAISPAVGHAVLTRYAKIDNKVIQRNQ